MSMSDGSGYVSVSQSSGSERDPTPPRRHHKRRHRTPKRKPKAKGKARVSRTQWKTKHHRGTKRKQKGRSHRERSKSMEPSSDSESDSEVVGRRHGFKDRSKEDDENRLLTFGGLFKVRGRGTNSPRHFWPRVGGMQVRHRKDTESLQYFCNLYSPKLNVAAADFEEFLDKAIDQLRTRAEWELRLWTEHKFDRDSMVAANANLSGYVVRYPARPHPVTTRVCISRVPTNRFVLQSSIHCQVSDPRKNVVLGGQQPLQSKHESLVARTGHDPRGWSSPAEPTQPQDLTTNALQIGV